MTQAGPVREVTGMEAFTDGGKVAVVDRPGWIRANVDGFRVVLEPLIAVIAASRLAVLMGAKGASMRDPVTWRDLPATPEAIKAARSRAS